MFKDAFAVKSALLHRFSEQFIVVVGDVMLDRYIWGTASRISPEAPVPVVRLSTRSVSLGGAANVANNLKGLGVSVALLGYVGKDTDADCLQEECLTHGIDVSGFVSLTNFCTITKTRIFVDSHQLLRVDEEITNPRSNQESDLLLEQLYTLIRTQKPSAVILSDYAKGLCTPYFCQQLMAHCRTENIPVYVDPKGTDYGKYAGATAIKPNRSEMAEVARAMNWSTTDVLAAAKQLRTFLDLEFVALTLGAQGIAVIEENSTHEMPTVAREVFDVSGAGDTVIAAMVAGLSSGLPLQDAVALANVAAAQVVARIGSTPVSREDLLVAVQATTRSYGRRKLFERDDLQTLVSAWRRQGLRVALTNGCFDLLHAGHIRLLENATAQADRLIVALNSDASVRRLKGEERPFMPQEQRTAVLSALESVDAVIIFDEDTPLQIIESIRPDLLIKGGNYSRDTVVGADFVESYGGIVILVPLIESISNSRLAAAISRL